MTVQVFIWSVLALLLAPGPTNTLMGIAGAEGGLRRVARLIPAELAGYATAILPLSLLGAHLTLSFPAFALMLKAVAAVWVALLAFKLWVTTPGSGATHTISPRRVYITTCLNPKALIFSLVLLPTADSAAFLPRLALFVSLVVAVALVWGALGATTRKKASDGRRILLLQRIASAWLLIVSLSLVVNILQA